MAGRRGTWMRIAGAAGLIAVVAMVLCGLHQFRSTARTRVNSAGFNAQTPLDDLIVGLRGSDHRALSALNDRLSANPDTRPPAIRDDEAKTWLDMLAALRTGYLKYGTYGRITTLAVATKIFNRFAIDTAPACWIDTLGPVNDILGAGMIDPNVTVRAAALGEMGRLWGWTPGRAAEPGQEDRLGEWKAALNDRGVLRGLADRAPEVRAAAVACLGNLPVDRAAASAIPYLEDATSGDVRRQVLISFAKRPSLLTEDQILKRLYDTGPGIPELATLVLKTRGLTQEQISLGKMIFHPKAELRASVIPLLRDRTDVDPVVWLLQLSNDSDANVRAGAVDALGGRLSPQVRRRLAEMAATDKSPVVRQAASKIVPPEPRTTANLPPLPGLPSLRPKAN